MSGGEVVKTEEPIPSKLRLMSPDVGGEVSLSLSLSFYTARFTNVIKHTNKIIMARGMLVF